MNRVAFFVTQDQVEALQALEVAELPTPNFSRATWQALANKGLVTLDPAPRLTHAGRLFNPFNRALEAVNRLSAPEVPTHPSEPSHAPARARLKPLV